MEFNRIIAVRFIKRNTGYKHLSIHGKINAKAEVLPFRGNENVFRLLFALSITGHLIEKSKTL